MQEAPTWSERVVAYALGTTASSGFGCLSGIFLFAIAHGHLGSLVAFSVGGFTLGLLAGPIVGHLFFLHAETSSAADTAEAFTRTAALNQLAGALFPYAFASAIGSTLACLAGIGIFAISRGQAGPLALWSAGGFLLGSVAGLAYARFSSSLPALGEMPPDVPQGSAGGVLTAHA